MATQVRFDLSELVKFPEDLKKKLINEWMLIALNAYALTLERMVVLKIQEMNLSVSGDMMGSITSRVVSKVNEWLITVGTNLKTKSGYPYPVGVHEGTIKHRPPLFPILKYVEKKFGQAGKEGMAHARALQNSISKFGTKPHPFMQAIFDEERPYIESRISYELGRVIASQAGKL